MSKNATKAQYDAAVTYLTRQGIVPETVTLTGPGTFKTPTKTVRWIMRGQVMAQAITYRRGTVFQVATDLLARLERV